MAKMINNRSDKLNDEDFIIREDGRCYDIRRRVYLYDVSESVIDSMPIEVLRRFRLLDYSEFDRRNNKATFLIPLSDDIMEYYSIKLHECRPVSSDLFNTILQADRKNLYLKNRVSCKKIPDRPNYSKVKVYASFAKPCSDVSKYYDKFAEAAHWANYVLFTKHKIILHEPTVLGTDTFEMVVEVPETAGSFDRANHLRGIARYLLKYYPNDFQKYRSGTRLLKYVIEEV